jgi:tetratricopeptide (TPR) repeat protein
MFEHREARRLMSVSLRGGVLRVYGRRRMTVLEHERRARGGTRSTEQALQDYDRALAIDPAHADAALNRGVRYLRQRNLARAAADLRLALQLGADAATVHYDLALVHLAAGREGAGRSRAGDEPVPPRIAQAA